MPTFHISLTDGERQALELALDVEAPDWKAGVARFLEEIEADAAVETGLCRLEPDGLVRIDGLAGLPPLQVRQVDPGPDPGAEPGDDAVARWLALAHAGPVADEAPTRPEGARVQRRGMERTTLDLEAVSEEAARAPAPRATPARVPAPPRPRVAVEAPAATAPAARRDTVAGSPATVTHPVAAPRSAASLEALVAAAAGISNPTLSAEQAIDLCARLVSRHVGCDAVQCLMPQQGGEGWYVVAAHGRMAGSVMLKRLVIEDTPFGTWLARPEQPARVLEAGLTLAYVAPRRGGPVTYDVSEALMLPVRHEARVFAVLLATGVTLEPVFEPPVVEAMSRAADCLAVSLARTL